MKPLQKREADRFLPWLIEIGPSVWFIAALWFKMMYFSLSLRSVWIQPEETIADWIRAYPHIFSATLASLLLLCGPLSLIARGSRFVILLLLNFCLTSLVVADLVHVHYYGDVISVLSLSTLPMLPWIQSTILHLLKPIHAVFYVDILVGIRRFPFYLRACRMLPKLDLRYMKRVALELMMLGFSLALPTVNVVVYDQNRSFTYISLQREVCCCDRIVALPRNRCFASSCFASAEHK